MSSQFKAFEICQIDQHFIQVAGEIDVNSVLQARREGEALMRNMDGAENDLCIVDLNNLGQAHSVIISMLLCWMRLAEQLNLELAIINTPAKLVELARVSSLDLILPLKRIRA